METTTSHELHVTRLIKASPQAVWDAWTKPELLQKWSCPVPGGLTEAEIDLRVGGRFRMKMDVEGGPFTAFGTYTEITPPTRIAYTWDWEEAVHAVGDTLVTVEFTPKGDRTEVSIRHSGLPTAESRDGHKEGWSGCFANLDAMFG